MFSKILIANRGEIACRVAASARRMGVKTVAVYSDADAQARHVAVCDEAVLIGSSAASESYLLGDRIISAALATGAQAIHPGYGFLSENADFADACVAAGLVFIGPPAAAMRAMGSKSAAKTLMEQAAVPLVPGYHGERQEAEFLQQQADLIGYPVLLKASAGGGGKGMRVIEAPTDFKAALASCKREAMSSFGDDKVLVEKYLQRPRHIEIQVFADGFGNCVYLFERDCSVQRRHQKVLEEAPAPGMSAERRAAMGQAAVAAAQAVGYVGAGTVEFIANQDGSFYFMEMNTRLQVEHPVTEMITGTDLVAWQLLVANGGALPLRQDQLTIHGHAIEARIYAENPDKGFLPSTGTLRLLDMPSAVNFELGGQPDPAAVRIDSGVRAGDTISPFYDPMIAKLIVWGPDRNAALARMSQALEQVQLVGLASNVAFLQRLVRSQSFATADLDTGLIERNQAELFPAQVAPAFKALALAAISIILAERTDQQTDPWGSSQGWRMNHQLIRCFKFTCHEQSVEVSVAYSAQGWMVSAGAEQASVQLRHLDGETLGLQIGSQSVTATVVRHHETVHVFCQGQHLELDYADPLLHAGASEAEAGRLTAPMPGKIVALLVAIGQTVAKGDALLIMEAMKMEHTIAAPRAGVVKELRYLIGDQVTDGAQLLTFE